MGYIGDTFSRQFLHNPNVSQTWVTEVRLCFLIRSEGSVFSRAVRTCTSHYGLWPERILHHCGRYFQLHGVLMTLYSCISQLEPNLTLTLSWHLWMLFFTSVLQSIGLKQILNDGCIKGIPLEIGKCQFTEKANHKVWF